jgi:hypothetical protein
MALYPIVRARLQSKDFREDSLMRYLALTHPTRSAIALDWFCQSTRSLPYSNRAKRLVNAFSNQVVELSKMANKRTNFFNNWLQ